jgi:ferredoxin
MTTIERDGSRCTGIGICESIAEKYFTLRDDGELQVYPLEVPPEDLHLVEEAVGNCPNLALSLVQYPRQSSDGPESGRSAELEER